jgi:hypothetical protein
MRCNNRLSVCKSEREITRYCIACVNCKSIKESNESIDFLFDRTVNSVHKIDNERQTAHLH